MPNPSISGRRWRLSSTALAVGLLALPLALSSCGDPAASASKPAMPKAQVSVVVAKSSDVPLVAELTGRVEAETVSEVRPQVGGIVRQRLFVEGGEVKAGDVLYRIDPAIYEANVAKAEAALALAKASLPSAQSKVDRYRGLVGREAVSRQDFEAADAALKQAAAQVSAAEAELASARIDLDHSVVRAPIGGRIERSSVTEGALVSAGQASALTVIRSTGEVNVDLVQSVSELAALKAGLAEGRLTTVPAQKVDLLVDGRRYPHQGLVEFSEGSSDPATGTYSIRARVPNPDGSLLPGMFVRASVEQASEKNVQLVPQRAVSRNPKGEAVVLVVGKGDVVEQRVVHAERTVGADWVVRACATGAPDCKGVADGERIVMEGSQSAKPGSEVVVSFFGAAQSQTASK